MGLLGDIFRFGDRAKRKVRNIYKGLTENPKDYLEQAGDIYADNWKQVATDPLNNLGPDMIGKIVYHGSPHKFSKFDMSKIGTGEGAQAYGHGLYMAEAPDVAKSYMKNELTDGSVALKAKEVISQFGGDMDKALAFAKEKASRPREFAKTRWTPIVEFIEAGGRKGSLYKTDIPDEAVARFLDWDKPLSQQAPEVQKALKTVVDGKHGSGTWDEWIKRSPDYRDFRNDLMETVSEDVISKQLLQQGIPGIRYLDGGSRSAGQGSSNFVLFDDKMARIIERNGEKTGLQPWSPNEWDGLSYRDPFGDTAK